MEEVEAEAEEGDTRVHAVDVRAGAVVAGGLSGKKEKVLHADVDLHQVRIGGGLGCCWFEGSALTSRRHGIAAHARVRVVDARANALVEDVAVGTRE